MLEVRKLHASIEGKEILKGLNLSIQKGETHAIMGPNGSGKSTFSYVLMGHPAYKIESGDILWDNQSILDWPTEKRARGGLFLSFQYPASIPGVTVNNFMRNSLKSMKGEDVPIRAFRTKMRDAMASLDMDDKIAGRYVNDGFSGGEKKRNEILQLSLLQPRLAILDEIDSGLDIDALRIIAQKIEKNRSPDRAFLFITHYQRLLNYLTIDKVHVFINGSIVKSGGRELAEHLEKEGYDKLEKEQAI